MAWTAVCALVCVASLADFDLRLREDGATNRVAEALAVCGQHLNAGWAHGTRKYLVLSKPDLLRTKLAAYGSRAAAALRLALPDYAGDGSYDDALCALRTAFVATYRGGADDPLSVAVVDGLDVDAVERLFRAIHEELWRRGARAICVRDE